MYLRQKKTKKTQPINLTQQYLLTAYLCYKNHGVQMHKKLVVWQNDMVSLKIETRSKRDASEVTDPMCWHTLADSLDPARSLPPPPPFLIEQSENL